MKALCLKSISWSLIMSAIMCMVTFAACSDDDEPQVTVEFPELKEEVRGAGETVSITFSAQTDWTLISKASWCKFVDGDFKETTRSGKAGDQTILAEITGEGMDYSNDNTAEIVLMMGGQEQVIYKIIRLKKMLGTFIVQSVPETEGEDVVVYGEENPIVVKGCDVNPDRDGSLLIETLVEDATLQVGVNEGDNPGWVKVEKVEKGFKLSFNRDNAEGLAYNRSIAVENGGHIIFSVVTADKLLVGQVAIPMAYEGLKEEAIMVEPAYANLSVSPDGKTFTEIPSNMDGTTANLKKYENELNSTVTVLNDKFHYLIGSAVKKEILGAVAYEFDFTQEADWVNVTTDGANVKVVTEAIAAGSNPRGAIVLVLSDAAYNKVMDGDINENLIEVDELGSEIYHSIKSEYANGLMAVLIQEPEKEITGDVTLTAFYVNDVTDWSKVKESDLIMFDDKDGECMMQSGDEVRNMLTDFGLEVMGKEVYLMSGPNLKQGVSYCFRVDNVPSSYVIGMNYTPWTEDEVKCHEELINGNRYFVLTGLKDNINYYDAGYSLVVGNPDMGVFAAECYFQLY